MSHERSFKLISGAHTNLLLKIFGLNFILTWTEQTCIFQFLGNLTFDTQTTIIESLPSATFFDFLFFHMSYILGITIGCIFFNFLFGFLLLKINDLIVINVSFTYSRWLRYLNFGLISLIICFGISSLPFYSIDYLIGKPLGYVSEDKAFWGNIFSGDYGDKQSRLLGYNSGFKTIDTDVSYFDRGEYLEPKFAQSFEDINYHGEYFWTSRVDRINTFGPQRQRGRDIAQGLFKNLKKLAKFDKKTKENINDTKKTELPNKNFLKIDENKEKIAFEAEKLSLSKKLGYPLTTPLTMTQKYNNDYELLNPVETYNFTLDNIFSKAFTGNTLKFLEYKNRAKEKQIKLKYYNNNVYKFLVSSEIDFFLNREPSSYKLNSKEEKNLFEKRLIISNYLDSLRFYTKLPFIEDFQQLYSGSKSYADRVYNQQFKGTLRVVRRLFSLTLNEDENPKNKMVLKYDQPLFKNNLKKTNLNFHEELSNNLINKNSLFFEMSNTIPFYIGWDTNIRKLLITNRYLPRYNSSFNLNVSNELKQKSYKKIKNLNTVNIEFSSWPIPKTVIENTDDLHFKYVFLFETIADPANQQDLMNAFKFSIDADEQDWSYETLPESIIKANGLGDIIPPVLGGYIWPGKDPLKFQIDLDALKNMIKK